MVLAKKRRKHEIDLVILIQSDIGNGVTSLACKKNTKDLKKKKIKRNIKNLNRLLEKRKNNILTLEKKILF